MSLSFAEIEAAGRRIAGAVIETPMIADPGLARVADGPVWIKQEYRQITGAFKLRGATNAVLSLPDGLRERGVVTASTGNHGRALAHAGRAAGVNVVVCLSRLVPQNKLRAIAALGAEIRIIGQSQDDAMAEVARAVRTEGLIEIPPFDCAAVIAGQGTLGCEMLAQCPDADTLLVPLSGGGLAAGVALAAKTLKPGIRVVGLSMQAGAAMAASLTAGHPVALREEPSLADSLGGGIGLDNRLTFAMCRALLDDVVLLSEAEIAAGMRHIHALTGDAVEGAAAVGVAALLAGRVTRPGCVIALATGANVARETFARVLAGRDERVAP